jgi:hypothetical protein
MPPGVKNITKGLGEDQSLYYQTDDGNYHTEDEAREMKITHSTLPTKSSKVKK